jgi:hypothetical protein
MAKATAKKVSKKSARKPAKAARAKSPAKVTAKAAKGEVVYSDLRRDALAWQLAKLR